MFKQEWFILIIAYINNQFQIKELNGFKNQDIANEVAIKISENLEKLLKKRKEDYLLFSYNVNISVYRKK